MAISLITHVVWDAFTVSDAGEYEYASIDVKKERYIYGNKHPIGQWYKRTGSS